MIKIGCAAYSYRQYFQDGSMTYESFLEECYRSGLDGAELTLYYMPAIESSYLKKLRRLALSYGLAISSVGTRSNFSLPTAEERQKQAAEVHKWIDVAHELGSPCLRIFGGLVPEGYTVKQAVDWAIEGLKLCVKDAEDRGVVLALENHGGTTGRADDTIRIVDEVNSEWLRINLDLGNYSEDLYDGIRGTIPYTVHAHAKVSTTFGGKMKLDYAKIKSLLQAGGYNGFLSIEYEEAEDPKTGVPEFARFLLEQFR